MLWVFLLIKYSSTNLNTIMYISGELICTHIVQRTYAAKASTTLPS